MRGLARECLAPWSTFAVANWGTRTVKFEALPEREYIDEANCPWSDEGGGGCTREDKQ